MRLVFDPTNHSGGPHGQVFRVMPGHAMLNPDIRRLSHEYFDLSTPKIWRGLGFNYEAIGMPKGGKCALPSLPKA